MKTVITLLMLSLSVASAVWAEPPASSSTQGGAGAGTELLLAPAVRDSFTRVDEDGNGMVTLLDIGRALQRQTSRWMSKAPADEDRVGHQPEGGRRSAAQVARVLRKADGSPSERMRRAEYDAYPLRQTRRGDDLPYVVPNLFDFRF